MARHRLYRQPPGHRRRWRTHLHRTSRARKRRRNPPRRHDRPRKDLRRLPHRGIRPTSPPRPLDLADTLELVRLVTLVNTSSIHLRLCLAAIVMLAATGCDSHDSIASPPPVLKTPTPAPQLSQPKSADKTPYRTTGPLVAEQQSDVAAQRDGRIASISVALGDRVKRGQELAALDERTLRSAVESQTAKLESLRAQVREWEAEEKMDSADLRRADQMRASKILSEAGWEHVKYKLDEVT